MAAVARPTKRRAAGGLGAVVALLAVAVNQRPAVASIGPVLDEIRRDLPLSSPGAAVLTAAPVVCFGVLAPIGHWLERRTGLRPAVGLLSAVLVAGLVLRLGPDTATLFGGTVVAAGAIAAMNVLLPAMVRLEYPRRTGLMMGLYTTGLTGAAAAAAGLTVPLQHATGGGWRAGLAPWAALAAIGFFAWLPMLRSRARDERPATEHLALAPVDGDQHHLRRDRLAWLVTGFFGLQSAGFYAVLTWLPTLFTDHGIDATRAGALLSISAVVQTPVALITPTIATRSRRQGSLVAMSCLFTAVGFGLLLAAPVGAAYPAVVILGIGQGAAFPLALTIMVMRAPSASATTRLSSMAQSIGYLLAALGPLLVGLLHAATGGWSAPLLFLLALLLPQLLTGVLAGQPRST